MTYTPFDELHTQKYVDGMKEGILGKQQQQQQQNWEAFNRRVGSRVDSNSIEYIYVGLFGRLVLKSKIQNDNMMMNITLSKCLPHGLCLSCENDMYVQCYAYVLMLMTMQMDKSKMLHQPMKFLPLKKKPEQTEPILRKRKNC